MSACVLTYWEWQHPQLQCMRRTPDPWTAAVPWSCSAGSPSVSRIQPAPLSWPRKTPPTAQWTKRKQDLKQILPVTMQLNEASDNACVLKGFPLVPGEGSMTALLYFWDATLCLCQANRKTQICTGNTHITTLMSLFNPIILLHNW